MTGLIHAHTHTHTRKLTAYGCGGQLLAVLLLPNQTIAVSDPHLLQPVTPRRHAWFLSMWRSLHTMLKTYSFLFV